MEIELLGRALRIPLSLILFLSALASTLLLTPVVRRLAVRLGALALPGPRRIHTEPVPTLGGLAIAVSALGASWGAFFLHPRVHLLGVDHLLGLTLASLVVIAVGVVDDLRGLPASTKLVGQTVAAAVLVLFDYGIPYLTNPFGAGQIGTGMLDVPLTILWVLAVTNAINLIDGLDGLASGAVFLAAMTLWWVGRSHSDLYVMFLTAGLAGAALGFLRQNYPPARIFMGDTGSQFLGLALAAVSLIENRKGTASITLLFPLVALGLPMVDSAFAFVRRLLSGKPVFHGDSEHIHHRLIRIGLSPRSAVHILWYLSAYLGVMAVVVEALPRHYSWFVLVLLAMGLFLAFEVIEFVDRSRSGPPSGGGDAGSSPGSASR